MGVKDNKLTFMRITLLAKHLKMYVDQRKPTEEKNRITESYYDTLIFSHFYIYILWNKIMLYTGLNKKKNQSVWKRIIQNKYNPLLF